MKVSLICLVLFSFVFLESALHKDAEFDLVLRGAVNSYTKPDGISIYIERDDRGCITRISSSDRKIDYRYAYKNGYVFKAVDVPRNIRVVRPRDDQGRITLEKHSHLPVVGFNRSDENHLEIVVVHLMRLTYQTNADGSVTIERDNIYKHTASQDDVLSENLVEETPDNETWEYTYDALDRVIQAKNDDLMITYLYDPLGRCIEKSIYKATTQILRDRYLYVQNHQVATIDQNGKLKEVRVPFDPFNTADFAPVIMEIDGRCYRVSSDKITGESRLIDLHFGTTLDKS